MKKSILAIAFLSASVIAEAKVVLPQFITDSMVVQQKSVLTSASQSNPDSKDLVEQQNIPGYSRRKRQVHRPSQHAKGRRPV